MNYINNKTTELNEDYYDWDDILPEIRIEVNKFRKRDMNKLKKYQNKHFFDDDKAGESKFNIGDYVHWKINKPTDIRGKVINDGKFRHGDRIYSLETRSIVEILYYPSEPYYRYKLKQMPHVSFSMFELIKSKSQENTYIVKKILAKRIVNKVVQYKVQYKNETVKQADYYTAEDLIDDDLQDYIDDYEEFIKTKKK